MMAVTVVRLGTFKVHEHEVYLPYTSSDETFTCFNCGISNFSSGLFDTVLGDSVII